MCDECSTCQEAALKGHIKCLKFLHENNYDEWTWKTTANAAKGGYLECLRYAYTNGCKWNFWTTAWAAGEGNLKCLIYAHEHGCDWDWRTTKWAAGNGELLCLIYAVKFKCDWNIVAPACAALEGRLKCLKFFVSIGFDISQIYEEIFENAQKCKFIEVVNFLKLMECSRILPVTTIGVVLSDKFDVYIGPLLDIKSKLVGLVDGYKK
jgi:hypothetical protein